MWTPEIIRARYVEAAHTEQFLAAAKGPGAGGYWPEFYHDDEDREGWDDAARLDNADKWKGRASTGAISRHQECMIWTAEIVKDETHRHIVWAWAFCRANDWDFGARCNRRGWKRPTAYRRLTATIDQIASNLNRRRVIVRIPGEKWLRQEDGGGVQEIPTLKKSVKLTAHLPFLTEKPSDTLKTPAALAAFVSHLEDVNTRRRKANAWWASKRAGANVA